MTVLEIITNALKMTGIQSGNQALDSDDAADALARLNGIFDAWNVDKLKSYSQNEQTFTLVPGQNSYTIGVAGDFSGVRPVSIENMFVRDPSGQNLDYNVRKVSFDEYNSITQKTIQSDWPDYFYYNPAYPLGTLSFYPTPSKAYTVHITDWYRWGGYTDTSVTIDDLPAGYTELLQHQLAVEMCNYFGKQVPPETRLRYNEIDAMITKNNSNNWDMGKKTNTPTSNRGYGADSSRTYIPNGVGR